MKKTLCILFAAFVLGVILVQMFDRYLDSENIFWREAVRHSDDWAAKVDARHPAKYVVAGGSSSRTSVDPAQLLDEYGIPFVNAALPAGFGLYVHIEGALPYLRRGDTLILCLEPSLLGMTDTSAFHTLNGDKFILYHLWANKALSSAPSRDFTPAARLLRGNSYQILVRSLRHIIGEAPYRYDSQSHLTSAGWLKVPFKPCLRLEPFDETWWIRHALPPPRAIAYLRQIVEWGNQNGVRVIYALPRVYSQENLRVYHAFVMLRLLEIMPVLKDETLGTDVDPGHFSDTINHASPEGAKLMTRAWGQALSKGKFWTRGELIDLIHGLGWNEDGTPREQQRRAEAR